MSRSLNMRKLLAGHHEERLHLSGRNGQPRIDVLRHDVPRRATGRRKVIKGLFVVVRVSSVSTGHFERGDLASDKLIDGFVVEKVEEGYFRLGVQSSSLSRGPRC